jgi:glycosyltransferase involved in cell wall biosynthesis
MKNKSHILIGGDGRSGTTFLVKLFTILGFDTGFQIDNLEAYIDNVSRGGLEFRLFEHNLPEVVKTPDLHYDLTEENLLGKDIRAVIIPIRPFEDVISSRFFNSTLAWFDNNQKNVIQGGISPGVNFSEQNYYLLNSFRQLIHRCLVLDMEIILLDFSRLISEPAYTYNKLQPIFNNKNVSEEQFLGGYKLASKKHVDNDKREKLNEILNKAVGLSVQSAELVQPILVVSLFLNLDLPREYKTKLVNWVSDLRQKNVDVKLCVNIEVHNKNAPEIFVSLGGKESDFLALNNAPFKVRKRWIHVDSLDNLKLQNLMYCWIAASNEELKSNEFLPKQQMAHSKKEPSISVYTCAYKSEDGLRRAYLSLCAQTIENWEWVVVDDSADDGNTVRWLSELDDHRVRVIDIEKNIGYIGTVKGIAVSYCRSDIFFELDHDDVLLTHALESVLCAFEENPDIGFLFADAAEVNLSDGSSNIYNTSASFGYRFYYNQASGFSQCPTVSVQKTPPVIESNFAHLVGLPNHPRVWARWAYEKSGGYRDKLLVGDDYDLMIRTVAVTKFMRLQELLYIQFRNLGNANTTFSRNRQIQDIVHCFRFYYSKFLNDVFAENPNLISLSTYNDVVNDTPESRTGRIREEYIPAFRWLKSVVFSVSDFAASSSNIIRTIEDNLTKNLLCSENLRIIIVSPVSILGIADFANRFKSGKIIWWIDESLKTESIRERYARIISGCEILDIILL